MDVERTMVEDKSTFNSRIMNETMIVVKIEMLTLNAEAYRSFTYLSTTRSTFRCPSNDPDGLKGNSEGHGSKV